MILVLILLFGDAIAYAGDNTYQSMTNMTTMNTGTTMVTTQTEDAQTVGGTVTQPSANSVMIQNFAFTPATITVPQGTMVTWTNQDGTAHTVTADSGNGPTSGQLQQGQSYSFTFNESGTFTYHCSIHPQMAGTVVVTATASDSGSQASQMSTPATSTTAAGANTTMNATPNVTAPASTAIASSPYQQPATAAVSAPKQLPNTGPGNVLPLFLSVTVLGTAVHQLYVRRKFAGGL